MITEVSGLIAELLAMCINLAALVLSLMLAAKIVGLSPRRWRDGWRAWAIGVPVFAVSIVLLGLILLPIGDALRSYSCKSTPDYRACMDGD